MTTRHVFKHMPFNSSELHALAWDVEDYPKFINFISAIRLLKSEETFMHAEVRVKYKMLRESFVTEVRRGPEKNEISVLLTKGPLRNLENHWQFHPLSDGSTLVEFWVKFSFAIPLLGKLFQSKQERAEQLILQSFECRAKQCCSAVVSNMDNSIIAKEIQQLHASSKHA